MVADVDRPILTDLIRNGASSVATAVSSTLEYTKEALKQMEAEAELESAKLQARAVAEAELRSTSIPPWQTLSEQFAILEEELKARILRISQQEDYFTKERARTQVMRQASVLPGCLPMANAAIAADPALGELRFRLVPGRLTEEEFWRCYFWHVAQLKLELCNDFVTANRVRRDEAQTDEQAADDATSAALDSEIATELAGDGALPDFAFDLAGLDAEFEALVGTPQR